MKREVRILAQDAIGSVTQEVWHPETSEERADALALTMRAKPSGWNVQDELNEIRGLIDKALSGMGWPNSKQRIAVNADGKWRPIEAREDVRENEKFWWSFLWIREAAPPLSEVFYLGNMVFSLECLQNALDKGDQLQLFHHAMRLGMYQSEIDVRKIALRYADVGKRQIAAGDEGRNQRSMGSFKSVHGKAAQARAHELLAEKPNRTWRQIQVILAKEFSSEEKPVSAETIRKSISNPKKDR